MKKSVYACWIIIPNIFIQIVLQGGLSAYSFGAIFGSTVIIFAISLGIREITKRCMKKNRKLIQDIINVASGYIIYYLIMILTNSL